VEHDRQRLESKQQSCALEKGHDPRRDHSPAGRPNRNTQRMRDAMMRAASMIGDPDGKGAIAITETFGSAKPWHYPR
jgi:hypothetical protein